MRNALLLAALLIAAGCEARPGRFPLGFDRMRDQPRYDAYEASPFFADGKTMRPLPDGTVARESPSGTTAVVDGKENGADVETIPVPLTMETMKRGQDRYDVFCRPCHDVDGTANSPVAKNMQIRQPPSLLEDRIRQLPDGRIYQVISGGYGLMPSYAYQLSIEDRWAVVAYVRALQLRAGTPLDELPATVRTEAAQRLGAR
jgi:mono/diheme cytochrome c family protein